jgi:hypothetical protein
MCKVLNKHQTRIPAHAVYIGRGSKWGNPFRIGPDGDRAAVIAKYERWLAQQPQLLRALDELCGRDLVCFCAPRPCHGDLLLRLANATRASPGGAPSGPRPERQRAAGWDSLPRDQSEPPAFLQPERTSHESLHRHRQSCYSRAILGRSL